DEHTKPFVQRRVILAMAVEYRPCNCSKDCDDQYPEGLDPEEKRLAAITPENQRIGNSEQVGSKPLGNFNHWPRCSQTSKRSEGEKEETACNLACQTEQTEVKKRKPKCNKGAPIPVGDFHGWLSGFGILHLRLRVWHGLYSTT